MPSPMDRYTCIVCGKSMSMSPSGCCSGRCRAAKSRHAADARRQHDLTEIVGQIDDLRGRVLALRDGERGGAA